MSKGTILFLHVKKLHQLYCRFALHREEVKFIRYLPEARVFVSVSNEMEMCIWRIHRTERHVKTLAMHRLQKKIKFFRVLERDALLRNYVSVIPDQDAE